MSATSSSASSDERGTRQPFGDPDGSRSDLDDLINLSGVPGGESLDFTGSDRRSRVIVGQKGSGKTVYLRRLRESVESDESLTVAREESPTQLLRTREILQIAHWYPDALLTEIWMQIWRAGILSSVASIIATTGVRDGHVSRAKADSMLHEFARLGIDADRERGVFASTRRLLRRAESARELSKLLDLVEWDDLEDVLGELLADLPPIFIFVDTIDEELRSAPMYWLRCQKGLFYQVMRFLRSPELGGRLHIVISIRDLVLSSVFRSEHAPRYRSDRHIRVLTWQEEVAKHFLTAKLRQLPSRYWRGNDHPPASLDRWVGFDHLTNRLGGDEDLTDYVLRHTHLLPREINLMGNEIGATLQGDRALTEAELLAIVSSVTRTCGQSNLDVVANQLLSDVIPVGASSTGFDEFYTSSQEYSSWASEQVRALVHDCERLWPTTTDVEVLRLAAQERFDDRSDLPSVLWQNGLLGYVDGDRHRFYSLRGVASFALPDAEQYVFHPCLREVAGLRPGDDVVVPYFGQ